MNIHTAEFVHISIYAHRHYYQAQNGVTAFSARERKGVIFSSYKLVNVFLLVNTVYNL